MWSVNNHKTITNNHIQSNACSIEFIIIRQFTINNRPIRIIHEKKAAAAAAAAAATVDKIKLQNRAKVEVERKKPNIEWAKN